MILAGAGELHIEIALGELGKILGEDVLFNVSPPVVGFSESVTKQSSVVCMAKSPNKHNRLYFTAEPLGHELTRALDQGDLDTTDLKTLAKQLTDNYLWDKNSAGRVWFFFGTNCLVDGTHGVPYLPEIKDSIRSAFEMVVKESVVCGEPLRGVRFNLMDAVLHADVIHRGPGQIIQPAQRALCGAVLAAGPCMVEPMYLTEIQTEVEVAGKIYSCMSQRRGAIHEEIPRAGTPLCVLRGYLPVLESFGFTAILREHTSGRAFPQLMFDHWREISGEIGDEGSLAHKIIMEVRTRKGKKCKIPLLEEYNEKL